MYEGDTLGKVLTRFIERNDKLTHAKLSKMTGISEGSLSGYIYDVHRPKMEHLIAICIALRLSYAESSYLLYLNNNILNPRYRETSIYIGYLMTCMFMKNITVMTCNEMLMKQKIRPLTKLRRMYK